MSHRNAAAFAALLCLTRTGSKLGDYWVIAAPTVSASARVSGVGVAR